MTRIQEVHKPYERIDEVERDLQKARTRYGHYFRDDREFEYFWMLPLSDQQRFQLIRCIANEKRLKDELRSCVGVRGSSHDHKKFCIKCCSVDKYGLPYFS